MKRVLLIAALAAIACTASAGAHHRRPHRSVALPDPIAYMRVLSARYWQADACGGHYAVTQGTTTVGGHEANAWSAWIGPDGDGVETGDPALFHDCSIRLTTNTGWVSWATWRWIYNDWPEFCVTFLHETGHMTGHSHSADPRSVMSPEIAARAEPVVCMTSPTGERWHVGGSNGKFGPRPNAATIPMDRRPAVAVSASG